MAYDHSRKIGNQGDLVKHLVLHNCASELLGRLSHDDVFVYAESHCGRAAYVLPEGSEWKHGIGLLSSKKKEAREGHARIASYFDSSLSSNMKVGQQYFGSSNIVFRCLRSNRRKFGFDLHDMDVHVCDDLARYYAPWPGSVRVHNTDGYEGLKALASATLVLIDPPKLDHELIVRCIAGLRSRNIPYLCWTPRNSSSNGNKQESQAHGTFGEIAGVGTHLSVRWADPSGAAQHTFGCRLTVSEDLSLVADETMSQLVSLLSEDGWARD